MKSKIGISLMTAGCLSVAAAVCLVGMNISSDISSTRKSAEVLSRLETEIQKSTQSAVPEENETGESVKTVAVGDNTYAGIISIPAIGIELPVISSWSYDNLDIAPCVYYSDTEKMVVAAHNYAGHFGSIKELIPGDYIIFTDAGNNVKMYEVTETEVLGSHDVNSMISGDGWNLTLFTCTLSGTQRVTVRAKKAN